MPCFEFGASFDVPVQTTGTSNEASSVQNATRPVGSRGAAAATGRFDELVMNKVQQVTVTTPASSVQRLMIRSQCSASQRSNSRCTRSRSRRRPHTSSACLPAGPRRRVARLGRKFTSQNTKEPSHHTARSSLGKTRTQSARENAGASISHRFPGEFQSFSPATRHS